jgi:hypothetical protein
MDCNPVIGITIEQWTRSNSFKASDSTNSKHEDALRIELLPEIKRRQKPPF